MKPDALEGAARAALEKITDTQTIGKPLAFDDSLDGVTTIRFASMLEAYQGWEWVVSLATTGAEPTVLETELVAGEDSLRAPAWVPWADRLREYEETLASGDEVVEIDKEADSESELDDEFEDDDDDDDDDDEDEDDEDADDDDDDDDDLENVIELELDRLDGMEDTAIDNVEDEYVVVEDDE